MQRGWEDIHILGEMKRKLKPVITKNVDGYIEIYPRRILHMRSIDKYYCFNCGEGFADVHPLAFMDGIFLDKNKDLRKRSRRYVEESFKVLHFLPEDAKKKSLELLDEYNKNWGSRPAVAAAIYISAISVGKRQSQQEIADILNVTTSSLRMNYKDIVIKCEVDMRWYE